jgi:internalin A
VLGPKCEQTLEGTVRPKPPSEILASYFRIVGEAGEALGECKLIVVGRGGAGKTSLVKRLRHCPYDPAEPETHGITIQELDFDGRKGQVTARVWDFGGQVVLHSMHEFFLTARSLYLLVLGERDDTLERDAAYWLQLIRSYAGDAPVVVALNKSAGRQRHFDRETLEKNYPPILGWVATECSEPDGTAAGITQLRQTLTAALDSPHMESVRRKFPKKWHDIKADLEGMSESYLDYPVYAERCRKRGEPDDGEQWALAGELHDLGVALNYGRDPRLRDVTVLRPDWLANGIYAVLRANDLDDRLPAELNVPLAPGGVITADLLARIHRKAEGWKMLRAEDYPAPKRDFLLRLMDLFHLSYPLDDQGREQLVPTLLPLNPPDETEEPDDPRRVRLRYEFQVVPAPLLPWFIARSFALIPNRRHWRRGAMLAFDDARARVWATQDERYVFATVAGPDHARMRLLAIIRGTLRKIFGEYRALNPVEQWEHNGKWVPRETLEEFGVLPRERPDRPDDLPTGEEVES